MGNGVAFLREPQTTFRGGIGNYREDRASSPLGHTSHSLWWVQNDPQSLWPKRPWKSVKKQW